MKFIRLQIKKQFINEGIKNEILVLEDVVEKMDADFYDKFEYFKNGKVGIENGKWRE